MVDTCVAWCSPVLINAPSIINAASAIRTRKMVSALISLFFSSLFSKLFLLEFDWLKRLMYREGEELRTTHLNGAAFQGDRLASRRSSQADRNCKFACVCNGTLTGTGAIIAIEYCIQLYTFSSSVIFAFETNKHILVHTGLSSRCNVFRLPLAPLLRQCNAQRCLTSLRELSVA